jgi:DNA-binding response OmpR family regulator/DNA-binding CsgD family transcriptional regulator
MNDYEENDPYLALIVDDSPDTISMLNEALEKAGMSTLVALDGAQALSIAQRMLPDIILLDAIMPNMDGFEVCKRLKQDPDLKNIPVIFMTGMTDTEHVVKGFNAGGIDYICKPIINTELIARIRVHITNNRLAMSAKSALDLAGQYVLTVKDNGSIVWSTPQVNQLLESAGGSEEWLNQQLKSSINVWLGHNPSPEMGLTLKAPNRTLRLVLLGNTAAGEYLLRLVDHESPNDSLILQEALDLTTRQAEVLYWITKGKTNAEIGLILGTRPRTVNKHLEKVYKKLEVENRTSAATRAIQYLKH